MMEFNDPMMGIFRHADAGYEIARQSGDDFGVKIPIGNVASEI